jgi:Putative zinc-finger
VADTRKFGTPKVLQFGDKTAGNQSGDTGHCAQCEAMLADAIDGTLSTADQAIFDAHMAECGPCAQLFADARRGAAWLEMLRTPAPEPPAALLERILAQTSGDASRMIPVGMQHAGIAGATLASSQVGDVAALTSMPGAAGSYGNVIPFHRRAVTAVRSSSFGQIVLQPRLAMTAAMAFFSIALTMNLLGVHPLSLRASDLTPSSLKRDYYSANARVVRYYEGLRVVYELESRVHDLQTATDNDPSANSPSAEPIPSPSPRANPSDGKTPATQPGQTDPATGSPAAQPDQKERQPKSRPAPNSGTSRREGLGRPLYGLASVRITEPDSIYSNIYSSFSSTDNSERVEGSLV